MEALGDQELLLAARQDAAAFCVFYERHASGICGFLEKQGANREAAVDLTAETFAQALVSLHRFRGRSDAEARGWIYGIARNLSAQLRRRERRETAARARLGMPIRNYGDFEHAEERADRQRQQRRLRSALAILTEEERDALALRVVDELSYDAVAAQQGIAVPAARMRVHRALTTLRTRLKGS